MISLYELLRDLSASAVQSLSPSLLGTDIAIGLSLPFTMLLLLHCPAARGGAGTRLNDRKFLLGVDRENSKLPR